jgi:phosphonate transport system ATP-binding protein
MQVLLADASARHPAARGEIPDAVRHVSLVVQPGEHVAIIGPSGAGKTTLLQLIACALKPTTGQIKLGDVDPWTLSISGLQKLRGTLFLAPQVPPLPPRQRVVTAVLAGRLPQMGFWASLRSLFYPTHIEDADSALAKFDLSEKLFDRVDRLSGGERQRVGLARILTSGAQLLLVDEPLSALDPSRSEQAVKALTDIATERGATLVATLHHVDMALRSFGRIIGMRDGQVIFDLPAAQVSALHLTDLYAQRLHELDGPATVLDSEPAAAPRVAVTHCR